MPGLNLVIGNDIHIDDSSIASRLKYSSDYKYTRLMNSSNVYLSYSGYEEYPIAHVQCNGFDVYIEGIIYNMTDVKMMASLSTMIENLANGSGDMANHIKRFVDAADGDYFVVCISSCDCGNGGGRYIAFNDKHSRLPIYWRSFASRLIVSRDLNFVLSLIEPSINTWGLAEYMIFSYTLGEKTIFDGIHRTKQSRAFWSRDGFDSSHSILSNSSRFDRCRENNIDQDSCAQRASILFEESCANRVAKLEPLGRSLMTLSGGFDSRTVYAGIRNAGGHVMPVTCKLITGDESKHAQAIAAEFGDNVECVEVPHLWPRSADDFQRAKDIVRFTEGQIPLNDCYPNFLLFRSLADRFHDSYVLYLGFGGEWLRRSHKPKRWQRTIRDILWNWRKPVAMFCRVSPVFEEDEIYQYLESEINSLCKGYDPESIVKWLYYQYYNGLVLAGEERCRLHHWTVSPLMSLGLVDFYVKYVWLEHDNLDCFLKFMTLVDERTMAVDTNHTSLPQGKVVTDSRYSLAKTLRQLLKSSKAMCMISDILLNSCQGRLLQKTMGLSNHDNPFGLQEWEIEAMCKEIDDMGISVEPLREVFSGSLASRRKQLNCSFNYLAKLFAVYAYIAAVT